MTVASRQLVERLGYRSLFFHYRYPKAEAPKVEPNPGEPEVVEIVPVLELSEAKILADGSPEHGLMLLRTEVKGPDLMVGDTWITQISLTINNEQDLPPVHQVRITGSLSMRSEYHRLVNCTVSFDKFAYHMSQVRDVRHLAETLLRLAINADDLTSIEDLSRIDDPSYGAYYMEEDTTNREPDDEPVNDSLNRPNVLTRTWTSVSNAVRQVFTGG